VVHSQRENKRVKASKAKALASVVVQHIHVYASSPFYIETSDSLGIFISTSVALFLSRQSQVSTVFCLFFLYFSTLSKHIYVYLYIHIRLSFSNKRKEFLFFSSSSRNKKEKYLKKGL
jgi:hypothetical protein